MSSKLVRFVALAALALPGWAVEVSDEVVTVKRAGFLQTEPIGIDSYMVSWMRRIGREHWQTVCVTLRFLQAQHIDPVALLLVSASRIKWSYGISRPVRLKSKILSRKHTLLGCVSLS